MSFSENLMNMSISPRLLPTTRNRVWRVGVVLTVLCVVGLVVVLNQNGTGGGEFENGVGLSEAYVFPTEKGDTHGLDVEGEGKRKLWDVTSERKFRSGMVKALQDDNETESVSVELMVAEWRLAQESRRKQTEPRIMIAADTHTTGYYGGRGGGAFAYNWRGRLNNPGVTKVCGRSGSLIDYLEFWFSNGGVLRRGGGGGGWFCSYFRRGECITGLGIRTGSLVDGIRFYSSGRYWMYHWRGGHGGHYRNLFSHGRCLMGVWGRSGKYLDGLQFYFGYYCPPGNDCSSGRYEGRRACRAGTYGLNVWERLGCTTTSAGHYSGAGWGHQQPCPKGQYQPHAGRSSCYRASKGHYVSGTGWRGQHRCGVGHYQSHIGQAGCSRASPGYYVSGTGWHGQSKCPAGKYQPKWAQRSCLSCPPGTFQPYTGKTGCYDSSVGHYARTSGLSRQTACPAGTYQPGRRKTGCIECPRSTYQPRAGQRSCPWARTAKRQDLKCGSDVTRTMTRGYNDELVLKLGAKPLAFLGVTTCHGATRGVTYMEAKGNGTSPKMSWPATASGNCVSQAFVDIFKTTSKPFALLHDYKLKMVYWQKQGVQRYRLTISCQFETPLFCGDMVMVAVTPQVKVRKYRLAMGENPIEKLTLTTCYAETKFDTKMQLFNRGSKTVLKEYSGGCGNKAVGVLTKIGQFSKPVALGSGQEVAVLGQTSSVHGMAKLGLQCCFVNDMKSYSIGYSTGTASALVLFQFSTSGKVVHNKLSGLHALTWSKSVGNSQGGVTIGASQSGSIGGSDGFDFRSTSKFSLVAEVVFTHQGNGHAVTLVSKSGTVGISLSATSWSGNSFRLLIDLGGGCKIHPATRFNKLAKIGVGISTYGQRRAYGYLNGKSAGSCAQAAATANGEGLVMVGGGSGIMVVRTLMMFGTQLSSSVMAKSVSVLSSEVAGKVNSPSRFTRSLTVAINPNAETRLDKAPCFAKPVPQVQRVILPRSAPNCGSDIFVFKKLTNPAINDATEVVGVRVTMKYTLLKNQLMTIATSQIDVEFVLMDDVVYDQKVGIRVGGVSLGGRLHTISHGSSQCCCSKLMTRTVEVENALESVQTVGPLYLAVKVTSPADGITLAVEGITVKLLVKQTIVPLQNPLSRPDIVLYKGPLLTTASHTMMCPPDYFVSYSSSYSSSAAANANNVLKIQCVHWHKPRADQIEQTMDATGKVTSKVVGPRNPDPWFMKQKGWLECHRVPFGLSIHGMEIIRQPISDPLMTGYEKYVLGMGCYSDYGYSHSIVSDGVASSEMAKVKMAMCPPGLRACGVYVYRHPILKRPYAIGTICCQYLKYATRSERHERLSLYGSKDGACKDGLGQLTTVDTKERLRLVISLSDYLKQDVIVGVPTTAYANASFQFMNGQSKVNALMCQVPLEVARPPGVDIRTGEALVYRYKAPNGGGHFIGQPPSEVKASKNTVYACIASPTKVFNPVTSAAPYSTASTTCKTKHNRHMVKITNEALFIAAKVACRKVRPVVSGCWLGLRYNAGLGAWLWDDGSPLIYHKFDTRAKIEKGTGTNSVNLALGGTNAKTTTGNTAVKKLDPTKWADGQCAMMKNDNLGYWYPTKCASNMGVLCGVMKYQITRGDVSKRSMAMSCVPNLNLYLQAEELKLSFQTCTGLYSRVIEGSLLKHVSISISTGPGGYYVLYPQHSSFKEETIHGKKWFTYLISGNVNYMDLRTQKDLINLIAIEAMDKLASAAFVCFSTIELSLFRKVIELPPRSATMKASHKYLQKFALGPKCSNQFVQVADGYNDMVKCSEKVEFVPGKVTSHFFEIGIESCSVDDNDIDSYTVEKLQVTLVGSNRGYTASGKKVVTFHPLPGLNIKQVGANTLWQGGDTFRYYYYGNKAKLDYIGTVQMKYPNGAHRVSVKYQFCDSPNRIPAGASDPGQSSLAESEVSVSAEISFSKLRATNPKIYLVLYGTHDRKAERVLLDVSSDEIGMYNFEENIGRIGAIGFETPRTPENTGSYVCVKNLWIKYSDQKAFLDISHILHKQGYLGNVGYFDEQTKRFVARYKFPVDHPAYTKMAKELGTICLSQVVVQDMFGEKRFGRLFSNQIGSCDKCSKATTAYIEFPICKVNVVNCRWQGVPNPKGKPSPNVYPITDPKGVIAAKCENKQRFVYSECEVNRAVSVSWTESVSNHSFATATTTTHSGTGGGHIPSAVVRHVQGQLSAGIKGTWVAAGAEVCGAIGGGGDFIESTDMTNHFAATSSSSTISQHDGTVAKSKSGTQTVACSAKMMVPPSHTMTYRLEFIPAQPTYFEFLCDHELVLCTSGVSTDEFPHNIMVRDVHVKYWHAALPTCNVVFEQARPIPNSLKCHEEQVLGWLSGSTFAPNCVTGNVALYEPCQCIQPTQSTVGMCACLDPYTGNVNKNHGTMGIPPGKTATDTCRMLGCLAHNATFPK